MSRKVQFDLYLVTERHQTNGRPLLRVIEEALDAGVRAVQLREKELALRDLFYLAEKVRILTEKAGALLLINDRMDVCLAVGADGVHLRSDRFPIRRVRTIIGPDRLIGTSCHSVADVIASESEGADFTVLGPIYDTSSKRQYGVPLGKEIIQDSRSCTAIPILGIGGIQSERVAEVIQAGAHGVAMISGILSAEDIAQAVGQVKKALSREVAGRLDY